MLALLVSSPYSHSITAIAIIVSLDSLHAAAPIQNQLMRHSIPAIAVVIVDIISIITIITATKPIMITTIIMKMVITIIITIVVTITAAVAIVAIVVIHATNAIIMPKQATASHSSHFHSVPLHKYI